MTENQLAGLASEDKAPKPKRTRGASKAAAEKDKAPKPRRTRGPNKINIEAKVAESMTAAGTGIVLMGTMRQSPQLIFDGRVCIANAEKTGKAMSDLAKEDPRIRAALEKMFTTSSWAKVGIVAASTIVPIAACHGMAPAGVGQMFAPEGLEMPAPVAAPAKPKSTKKTVTTAHPQQPTQPQQAAPDVPTQSGAAGLPDVPR